MSCSSSAAAARSESATHHLEHVLVGRIAAARGPFDPVGRCQYSLLYGPTESVRVPCPAVLGEEELEPSRPVAEVGEPLRLDDVAGMEGDPGERR